MTGSPSRCCSLSATLRVATPLILCALGALFCERSGVIDLGLEGKMLAAAFAGRRRAAVTGSAVAGLLAGILIALVLSLLHGFACVTHRGDQVVIGMAITILAAGLTIVLGIAWFQPGRPDAAAAARGALHAARLARRRRRCATCRSSGPLYANLISGHNLLVYVALLAVPVVHWVVLTHALRPAPARGRREPARGRCRRHLGRRGCAIARC